MSALANLDPAGNAAVMVMLLQDDQAARILSELEPEELRLLGQKMVELGEIGPEIIAGAIAGFVEKTESLGLMTHDRVGHVRNVMGRAVGDVKAENLMRRIAPQAATKASTIELARWLEPEALAPLIKGEHPQMIAVLLVQLDPEVAAAVLHSLPAAEQSEIVHRIATLGPVSAEAITILEELLTRRIGERHGAAPLAMGGIKEAAGIINGAGKAVEARIMPQIAKMDKVLARKIEEEMFKFEHLFVLDAQSMGALLREVESDVLISALKGIPESEREVFFRAMSSRAADGVKDEIAARGRTKLAEVVEAQKAIVAIARRLAADGTIAFGSASGGDSDYV